MKNTSKSKVEVDYTRVHEPITREQLTVSDYWKTAKGKAQSRRLMSAIIPVKFDEKLEHSRDLEYESLMAYESEYGPVCNERDEIGSRQ